MNKYAEMSDTDINKLVAKKQHGYSMFRFDYCNDPAGAWPIILEYKIGIDTSGIKGDEDKVWWAELIFDVYGDNHYAEDNNPLRAAMIVYLMLDGEI